MKKYLFALVTLVLCTALNVQAEKTAKEQSFTNQILNYIRTEGYAPSIDSDGDIKFKFEGETFYVIVEEYADGYYIKVCSFLGTEDANRRGVLEACNAAVSGYKFVRCYLTKNGEVAYECTGFFSNLYQFKVMFPNYLDLLKSAENRLKSAYSDYMD